MELSNLLGVSGDLRLAEESFEDLRWIPRTLERMQHLRDAVKIYSEEGELLGILLHENQHWLLLTDIFAEEFPRRQFEMLAAKQAKQAKQARQARQEEGETEAELTVDREKFVEGIIEYFSLGLVEGFLCECSFKERAFYSAERVSALKGVLSDFLRSEGISERSKTVEICCGDGAATIALHELGIFPLTADINKCEICRGLREGVLSPKRSIVLNCAYLSAFFPKAFDCVFGFMLGKITPFNLFEWKPVLLDIPKALNPAGSGCIFLTFSSEWEAKTAKDILKDFHCEIMKNEHSDGYFDHWILIGRLKKEK